VALIGTNTIIPWWWSLYKWPGYCLFKFCQEQPESVSSAIVSMMVGTMAVILSCRVWLLFYDLKHGEAVIKHEWWSAISEHQDWFIRNKNKYGSFKRFLWKPVVILLIVMYSITGFMKFAPKNISERADSALLAFINTFWILLIFLFCKMPKQYDSLLIRKEINRLVIFYAVSVVWYTVTNQLELFSDPFWHFFNSFYTYLFTVIVTGMVTLWPSLQVKRQKVTADNRDHSDNNHASKSYIMYVNACADDKNWNLFMRHLIKEIAVENLCFLLEVMQFKFQFVTEADKVFDSAQNEVEKVMIVNKEMGWFMKLPNGLPTSSIIRNSNRNYVEQINNIYEKYISTDGLLSINISHATRMKYMSDMDAIMKYVSEYGAFETEMNHPELIDIPSSSSLTKEKPEMTANRSVSILMDKPIMNGSSNSDVDIHSKLIKLFDNCMIDIHKMLRGSFQRFQLIQRENYDPNKEIIDVMMKQQKD